MSSLRLHRAIEVQAEVLGPVLYSGVATSLTAAHKRREGLDHATYPHLLPLLVRSELREYFGDNPLPNGWTVGGDPRKMGHLMLNQAELGIQLRFLKERRDTYSNGVPIAGKNAARRKVWTDPLPLLWPADSDPNSLATHPVRLLLVWDFAKSTQLNEFTLQVVHTVAPGVYGKAVPCDLILDVKDGGEIFKSLEFPGSEEREDLFVLTEEEGNESGT